MDLGRLESNLEFRQEGEILKAQSSDRATAGVLIPLAHL
jgi:hypothetical protein